MMETVYLNGEFLSKENAKISPDDRGFIFADGVYEVVKYYNGKPFRYDDHLVRLKHSLSEIAIDYPGLDSLKVIFAELLSKNTLIDKHAGVYLQITRGENKRVHHFPTEVVPTVYAFSFELPSFTEKLKNGIRVITHEDIRWLRCDIKSVSLLANTMLYNKAVEAGAWECVLIRNGVVSEATHSSILGVKNGVVITHPLSNLILPGISRKVVLEICSENNILFEERPILKSEFYDMDEIILAGTGSEITPIIQVDDKIIGNNKPGEITRFVQQKFFEKVNNST
ncbi:MAG: D-amino-acid transaminase [Prolixibacteraceae bacterium]|jgi:D-alanine transaminase|nr:D-amino-acid transaminase [Prolixibacteraceae bacterium]MBT6765519.1 D-amino-acid transaminase [Prolixibacteraceae bacterium]MBT7000091.1 D-amino-acid transaminase [Prolixibacteraceae bacterium]MBT7395085.1 D-amino-acid transaminase [Prolixibacteraceae bacterium]